MSISNTMTDFLDVAEQKLSDAFSHARNAAEFSSCLQQFQSWLDEHSHILNAPNPLPKDQMSRIRSIVRKLTTLELVANNNAALVTDMPDYVDNSLSGLR